MTGERGGVWLPPKSDDVIYEEPLSCYINLSKLIHGFLSFSLLHGFVNLSKLFYLWISRPLPNKTRLKFDQDFKACWSFCFEIKLLNESKYSLPWVRCAFGNVCNVWPAAVFPICSWMFSWMSDLWVCAVDWNWEKTCHYHYVCFVQKVLLIPKGAVIQLDLRWRKVASLGQGKREDLSHACVVYNGSILLMGGQGEGEQVRSDDPNFVEHYQ